MDEETDFLDDMVGSGEPVTPEVQPEAKPEAKRDESGRFAPKEIGVEDAGSPPADMLPPEEYKELKAERRKRQDAEARIAALEQQLNPPAPPAPPPNVWEDEAGAFAHNRQQAVSEASFNARLDTSEMLAAQAHEDFDDMRAKFIEMMAINPALQQQALQARHPWGEAYKIAKNAARVEALGAINVDEVEAKVRAQIEAEYAAKAAPAFNIPRSLADAQSGNGGAYAPTNVLKELFG